VPTPHSLHCLTILAHLTWWLTRPCANVRATPTACMFNVDSVEHRSTAGCICMHRCKRVAEHVSKLADTLASTHPDIAVARVNCEQAVHFCDQVIRINRTPSFKVRLKCTVHY
jgi:hypothetical protein